MTIEELRGAWEAYAGMVFRPGALSVKEKRLIAYAAARLTRCPTCLEEQRAAALEAGATEDELTETDFAAMRAAIGPAFAFSSIALSVKNDLLADRSLLEGFFFPKNINDEMAEFRSLQASSAEFARFSEVCWSDGALSAAFKRGIMAMALAHHTKCPYCIRTTTRDGHGMGVQKNQMIEAIDVVMYMSADPCIARQSVQGTVGAIGEAVSKGPDDPAQRIECGC